MKKFPNTFFYWLISLTWGILMTIIGLIAALGCLIAGCKPYRFGYTFYFKVGRGWGGLTLGPVFFVCEDCSIHTKLHEQGHGIQHLIFGPFEAFIGIASAVRYWYREYMWKFKPEEARKMPAYDAIWFEGQATRLGYKYFGEEHA